MEHYCEYYYFSIIVNIKSSSTWNIIVKTTQNINSDTFSFIHMQVLNQKIKLTGGAIKSFSKKILGYENLSSVVLLAMKQFWKNLKDALEPLPTYLMYTPLFTFFTFYCTNHLFFNFLKQLFEKRSYTE